MKKVLNKNIILILGFLIAVADQVLKFYFYKNEVGFVNTGVSFSFFQDSNSFFIILTSFLLASCLLLLKYLHKYKLPLLLIIFGGLSNLVDRILYGGVVDYINLYFFENNLGDFLIFFGALHFCYLLLYKM